MLALEEPDDGTEAGLLATSPNRTEYDLREGVTVAKRFVVVAGNIGSGKTSLTRLVHPCTKIFLSEARPPWGVRIVRLQTDKRLPIDCFAEYN